MESNTELHQLPRCQLSLHKIQLNPVATTTEACDFCHKLAENQHATLFTLN